MATVRRTFTATPAELAESRRPVDGFVLERSLGDDRFEMIEGPYRTWSRSLEVSRVDSSDLDDGEYAVVERIEFRSAIPIWGVLFDLLARIAYRNGAHRSDGDRLPWWSPPDRFDAHTVQVVGVLSAVAILSGYLGTLITQTNAFAAEEFGYADDTSLQGDVLAVTRIGIFLAFAITAGADRRGRRPFLILSCLGGSLLAVAGAFSPSIWALAGTQTLSRGFATAMIVLFGIHVAEEVPAGSRAYAVSALALAAGLGSGATVWLLPLTDLDDPRAWRLLYLVPVLGLPLVWWIRAKLPESRRFEQHADEPIDARTFGAMVGWSRFALLAGTAFLMNVFVSPVAQLQNQYLKEEIGWGGTLIALFTLTTNLPRSFGVVVGGRLADTHGRRIVAVVGIVGLIATGVGTYASTGVALWIWALVGVVGAVLVPVFGVYGPELFPTRARGLVGGGLSIAGVVGSVLGLLVGGRLADSLGFGPAFALLAIGPLIVLALVVFVYPETAGLELETLNPSDRRHEPT